MLCWIYYWVLFLLIVALSLAVFYIAKFSYWKNHGVNYLKPTFPFGNAEEFFKGGLSLGELFQQWYLTMKEKNWAVGGAYFLHKPCLIPVDNGLIKKILISDFMSFPNHGLYINEKNDPFSGHIFNMEGLKWKNLRQRIPQIFTAAKMRNYVDIMERLSHEYVKMIANEEQPLNIKDASTRFTTDVISACAFGMQSNTMNSENQELLKQARPFFDYQFDRLRNSLVIIVPHSILRFFNFRVIPSSTTNYFMDMFKRVKHFREQEELRRNDLLDLLIDLCNPTIKNFSGKSPLIEPLTFQELATQLYIFFEAGFETSSTTQTFALYEIASNPLIQDKLRNEINRVLENYGGVVGYDAVNEMEYFDRVIDGRYILFEVVKNGFLETLRKYPIFPILPRLSTRDYKIPHTDIVIKKNVFVMVTNFGIHYDPEYYPDPMRFDPDRFTTENKAKRPHCAYVPFGEGPRICIGKRFGIWQTKIGIIQVLRNFRISVNEKTKYPIIYDASKLILTAKDGIWLNMESISK